MNETSAIPARQRENQFFEIGVVGRYVRELGSIYRNNYPFFNEFTKKYFYLEKQDSQFPETLKKAMMDSRIWMLIFFPTVPSIWTKIMETLSRICRQ